MFISVASDVQILKPPGMTIAASTAAEFVPFSQLNCNPSSAIRPGAAGTSKWASKDGKGVGLELSYP